MSTLLKTENLTIRFGGLCAVSDFDLDLKEGELVGLIGPNGAGKTTVFNMLSGVYKPSSGKIFLHDEFGKKKFMNKHKSFEIAQAGIARTFQNIRLFKDLSVLDNVRIAFHAKVKYSPFDAVFKTRRLHVEEASMTNKAMDLLKLFNIDSKAHEKACNLPYGEQRKLEIVRALATGPKILLLDEPAAGMNPQETKNLMDLIAFIRKEFKLTILLIEHDMTLVMGICERLIVLDYGKIIASGLPEEIRTNPLVIEAYLGSEA